MNEKNNNLIIVLLSVIATTLIIGVLYLMVNLKATSQAEEVASVPTPTAVESEVAEPLLPLGSTVVTFSTSPGQKWKCSEYGDPCDNVRITTEVDLYKASTGDELTGKFFIRAYNDSSYKLAPKIGEMFLSQNAYLFDGDGGNDVFQVDKEVLLTIKASSTAPIAKRFEDKFSLEYMSPMPHWNPNIKDSGYVLHLLNEGKVSDFNDRHIDFYFKDGLMDINTPL